MKLSDILSKLSLRQLIVLWKLNKAETSTFKFSLLLKDNNWASQTILLESLILAQDERWRRA